MVKDLFAAGIETTSSIIGFSVAYLSKYTDVQAKVHEEIDRVIGNETPQLVHKES